MFEFVTEICNLFFFFFNSQHLILDIYTINVDLQYLQADHLVPFSS